MNLKRKNIALNIWPDHHEYSKKELEFIVFSPILGDLNGDEILNVSDIIIIVNMALDITENDLIGDMNDDGGINILDIILLVNIILST